MCTADYCIASKPLKPIYFLKEARCMKLVDQNDSGVSKLEKKLMGFVVSEKT